MSGFLRPFHIKIWFFAATTTDMGAILERFEICFPWSATALVQSDMRQIPVLADVMLKD